MSTSTNSGGAGGLKAHAISREIRDLFNQIDRDKSGQISAHELTEVCKIMGMPPSALEEIDSLMTAVDKDGSGEIDLLEFATAMDTQLGITYSASELRNAFKMLSKEEGGDSSISKNTLEYYLSRYVPQGPTKEEVATVFEKLVGDARPTADYGELIRLYMALK